MTDRSEISTDRSDYNGSMGYFDENPGLGNGDISPRGAGLPAANIGLYGGVPERGGGGASPHARLMSWVGDGGVPSYPDTMGGGSQGTVGGQGQGQGGGPGVAGTGSGVGGGQGGGGGGGGGDRVVFGSRFQPLGTENITGLTGSFGDSGNGGSLDNRLENK